ncbi:MAG TPA: TonB family protein [Terriglobales bacterium]|jgi:protein TonB|nr:TonB family protein [Terriglobales bacterium]
MHMFQDETHTESHLERSAPLPLPGAPPHPEVQRKRMLIALGILLAALAAVVLKDWDFWFPPSPEVQEAAVRSKSRSIPLTPSSAPAAPAREHKTSKAAAPPVSSAPFSATTQRAVLPPLQVEVVAGNRHIKVPAKSNAIHLDVDSGATSTASGADTSVSNGVAATETSNTGSVAAAPSKAGVQLSPQTAQSVSVSVPPDYPLLARQMKVQGAVSLQALISREGTIQELQILSGPAILAAAAREAVKQWHFKPYLQNGQPVETQARITVNFTISTN